MNSSHPGLKGTKLIKSNLSSHISCHCCITKSWFLFVSSSPVPCNRSIHTEQLVHRNPNKTSAGDERNQISSVETDSLISEFM